MKQLLIVVATVLLACWPVLAFIGNNGGSVQPSGSSPVKAK